MEKCPRISVIIPTHNRANILKVALRRLVSQSLPCDDFEVIIVDDGSTDQTPQLCAKFAERINLKHVRQEKAGISAAKTLGVFSSSTPITFFFDDNDIADENLLAEHLKTHEQYPQQNYAVLGYTTWSPSLKLTPVMEYITDVGHCLFSYDHLHDGQVLDFTYFWGGRSSCKKSFLTRNGVFNQEMQGSEDIELAYRLSKFGLKVVFNRKAISYMIRPIIFDQFSKRCEKKGHTDFHFSRLHNHPMVQQYCEVVQAQEQWQFVQRTLDDKVARIKQVEAERLVETDRSKAGELLKELYDLYGWTFHAFKLKGIMEAKIAWEAESSQDEVHAESSLAKKDLQYFKKKWAEKPKPLPMNSNVLVVEATLPMYDRAAGSHRLFRIIEGLQELGNRVTFISRERDSVSEHYVPILKEMGVEVYAGDPAAVAATGRTLIAPDVDLEEILKRNQYDNVILSFWYIADFYLPLVRKYSPQSTIIVDSVDIHFVRELREAELKQSVEAKNAALKTKHRELDVYRKADRVWVVTPEEEKLIRELVPGMQVDVVPTIHPTVDAQKSYEETSNLMFVGNFFHTPNVDGIRHFCRNIFPKVVQELPDVKLYVIGNRPPESVKALATDNVIVTGYVEDLSPYLLNARVSISPLRYGAGMKGKVGEALSWGLPVVTTSIGAEGMSLVDGEDALVADEDKDFADAVVRLYNDQALWEKLSANGKNKVAREWSPAAIKPRLESIFADAESTRAQKLLSIVILAHNQLEYTKRCLDSIRLNTSVPYEIIAVDNASTDGTMDYLLDFRDSWLESAKNADNSSTDRCRDIQFIRNEKNLGYAGGNNAGIDASSGGYVLVLNNDTVVTPGWAERLIGCAEQDPAIGLVGPVTNSISGPQLVKRVPYDTDSLAGLESFSEEWAHKHSGDSQPFWRVVGFAMLIKREVIDRIGGLDERYGIGNFEDDDYSIRAAIAGYKSVIATDCFIHHFGSKTFSNSKVDYKKILHANWEVFKRKWELPKDMAYGTPYDVSLLTNREFDPAVHYIALDKSQTTNVERLFVAPRWDAPDTWQPVLKEYISAHDSSDGSLLKMYAGSMTDSDSKEVYHQVSEFLRELGADGDECPDIEIMGTLPGDDCARIILTGHEIDSRLMGQFPDRCQRLDEWLQAA